MADPASLARSILEAVSRAISKTVNATLAQVGMQPEIQQWQIWGRGPGACSSHPPNIYYVVLIHSAIQQLRLGKGRGNR